jgi:hypothetical protein
MSVLPWRVDLEPRTSSSDPSGRLPAHDRAAPSTTRRHRQLPKRVREPGWHLESPTRRARTFNALPASPPLMARDSCSLHQFDSTDAAVTSALGGARIVELVRDVVLRGWKLRG